MTDKIIQAKLKEIQDMADTLRDLSQLIEGLEKGERLTIRAEGKYSIAVFDYSATTRHGVMTSLVEWGKNLEKKIRDLRNEKIEDLSAFIKDEEQLNQTTEDLHISPAEVI